jgi:hypothetical protein
MFKHAETSALGISAQLQTLRMTTQVLESTLITMQSALQASDRIPHVLDLSTRCASCSGGEQASNLLSYKLERVLVPVFRFKLRPEAENMMIPVAQACSGVNASTSLSFDSSGGYPM